MQYLFSSSVPYSFLAKYKPHSRGFDFVSLFGADHGTRINDIQIAEDNSILFTGTTESDGTYPHPVTPGALNIRVNGSENIFVTRVNSSGTELLFSSILGSYYDVSAECIEMDRAGNIYIAGKGSSFLRIPGCGNITPIKAPDGFIFKLNGNCSSVLNLTYVGGEGEDGIVGAVLTDFGRLTVCGSEDSEHFPGTYLFNTSSICNVFVAEVMIQSIPSSPVNFTAREDNGFIALEWEPPADDGNSRITNYSIYRGTNLENLAPMSRIGPLQNFTDSDVEIGKLYYYSVSAENRFGEGSLSHIEGNISTTFPDPPKGIRAVSSIDAITIEFEPPEFTGGVPIDRYTIYKNGTYLTDLTAYTLNYIDLDIGFGANHTYHISSWNRIGESALSEPVTVRSKDVPSSPRNLTCTAGSDFVDLRWMEPIYNGDLDIDLYQIYKGVDPTNLSFYRSVRYDTIHVRDDLIEKGETIYYQVMAKNQLGFSEPSNTAQVSVLSLPQPPVIISTEPGHNKITILWKEPVDDGGSSIIGYNLYHGTSSDHLTLLIQMDPGILEYSHQDLMENRLHYYFVTAVSSIGESQLSQIVHERPFLVPTPPLEVECVPSMYGIEIRWEQPVSNGNLPIMGYCVIRRIAGIPEEEIGRTSGSARSFLDENVERRIEYFYSITAENEVGESDHSKETSARGMFSPEPPSTTWITVENSSLVIHWEPPLDDGGAEITTYNVFRSDPNGMEVLIAIKGPSDLSHTDLTPIRGMEYTYFVKAVNTVGHSDPGHRAGAMLPDVPGAPTMLNATALEGRVVLTWSVPPYDGGSEILGFKVIRSTGSGNFEVVGSVKDRTTIFIDETAQTNTVLRYKVIAINSVGEGDASQSFEIFVGERTEREERQDRYDYLVPALIALFVILVISGIIFIRRMGQFEGMTENWEEE
ncbi:MAG: fibronectin type III domain-containing protein [Thermoplasmatota archaeon]